MERWLPVSRQASGRLVERMISLSNIRPGSNVLDIATGIGDPAIDIARSNPSARVVGIDISPERLQVARKRSIEEGLGNTEFVEGDFEEIQLDNHFDAVFCKWGLMFFGDVPKAIRKVHSILRPGGTFTAAVWAEKSQVHSTKLTSDLLALLGIAPPPQVVDPFRFSDHSKLAGMLSDAGFAGTSVETVSVDYRYESIELLQEFLYDANYTFREALNLAKHIPGKAEVEKAIREAARPYMNRLAVVLPNKSILLHCTRP